MVDIRKSKLFPFQVDEEVTLRKLFEGILQETELGEISDVLISNPDNNDVLVYNETLMVWENQPLPPQTVGNLDDIGNVTITSVQDGDVLTWDSGTNQWVNEAPTGGGGTPGGSPTELQYNNAGAFGGIAGTAWDGTKLTIPASLQIGPSSAGTKTVVGTDILAVQYDHPTNAGSYSKLEMGRTGSTNTGWRLEAVGDGGSDTAAFVFTSESTAPEFNGNVMWHAGNFDPTTKQDTLVSGTNIRTVNGNTLLGSTDLVIATGATTLDGLTDVTITSVTNGQVLTYDSGTSQWINATPSGGGGLTHFTESVNTSAPNATVPVVQLLATNAATNVDVALTAKGTGARLAQIPDGTATGGNKRGTRAVDWQSNRMLATQVASGLDSAILGGNRNTASGIESVVAGGQTNNASGTQAGILSGNNNTASGTSASISGGSSNAASNSNSGVLAGSANTASGSQSGVVCGVSNQATALRSFIGGGSTNLASGESSWIPGGAEANTRGLFTAWAWSGARRSAQGDNQVIGITAQGSTTNNTPLVLTADRAAASATNILVMPNNSCWAGTVEVTGRQGANVVYTRISLVMSRGSNAASTVVDVQNPDYTFTAAALAGVAITILADTTRGGPVVQVTGLAATTIDWFAIFHGNQIVR
jgi:hypothetical protein